ncbi:MAG: tetratricopeptide repeat protein [Verrucomicrobia bacterium]|nr:tetratricopeptide repeat protein [Verrucomicrobiota bacterium]
MTRHPKLSLSLAALLAGCAVFVVWISSKRTRSNDAIAAKPQGPVTFNKHIAPILFSHCSSCHRPNQAAPFPLLTFHDAQKRAKQIADVTQRRIMPPWLPEPGVGDFLGARNLQSEQIELIQRWVAQGAVEGEPSDLPSPPTWTEGWSLGEPDLIVQMPEAHTLPAEGQDVYRNFAIPIPIANSRFVRGIEFRPGNLKVVHHAFIRFDPTPESRRLDALDAAPGFGGIHLPVSAQSPDGHFLSWQPGKVAAKPVEGLAWKLEQGSDLVLQMHLQPAGKPESVQSSVGFYFTDKPPTSTPFKIRLTSFDIDIPAGADSYTVKDSYVLPVDAEVLAVLPHAHYLGKKIQSYATLPNGAKQWLLLIREWNFNWQGDYRYAKPVALPRGTTLTIEFVYDNSLGNPRNPNQPPRRVQYGLQSSDEMAELWLQVTLRDAKDRETLARDYQHKVARETVAYNTYLLRSNPKDGRAQTELAKAMMSERRFDEAFRYLRAAVENAPDFDEAHYFLGSLLRTQKKLAEAKVAFGNALRANPQNFKAHGNLGLIHLEQGQLNEAESHFRSALAINPNDTISRESLEEILKARGAKRTR